MAAKRDYKQERRTAIKRGETGVGKDSGDNVRHKARRKVEKEDGPVPKGREVGHKRAIKSGGSNSKSNLRTEPVSRNRSNGGKSGSKAGKAAGGRKGGKG